MHTFKCASYICKSEAQRVFQAPQISCPSHASTLVALATFKGRVLIQANKWSITSPFIHDHSLPIQMPLQYFHFILPLVWLHRVEGKLVNSVQNCQMEEEAWSFPKLNADPKARNKSYKSVNIKLLIIHKSLPSCGFVSDTDRVQCSSTFAAFVVSTEIFKSLSNHSWKRGRSWEAD